MGDVELTNIKLKLMQQMGFMKKAQNCHDGWHNFFYDTPISFESCILLQLNKVKYCDRRLPERIVSLWKGNSLGLQLQKVLVGY